MRQRNINNFSAEFFVFFNGFFNFGFNFGVNAFAVVFFRQADAQPFNVGAQRFGKVGHINRQGSGIVLVLAADAV